MLCLVLLYVVSPLLDRPQRGLHLLRVGVALRGRGDGSGGRVHFDRISEFRFSNFLFSLFSYVSFHSAVPKYGL